MSVIHSRHLRRPLSSIVCSVVVLTPSTLPPAAWSEEAGDDAITTITVTARRVANLQPASTYAAPVTALRYDPRVDVQPRGLPEAQADVSVRGGLFENTAFSVAGINVVDPQTGHYAAELPVDPAMLRAPRVETGIESAIGGFAAVANVRYDIAALAAGGSVTAGAGSDALWFAGMRLSQVTSLDHGAELGGELAYAASQGDGSRPNGDHDFERLSARLEHRGREHRSNLLYGYQDKFFGWPGAYTGFANLPETDRTRTELLLGNHRRSLADGGWWEASGYYRDLEDDYDFDRTTAEDGGPGAFEHRTRSYGAALDALLSGRNVDWRLGLKWQGDELVRSTDLRGGDFSTRRYAKLSVVPEKAWRLGGGAVLTVRGGANAEHSNRDADVILPLAGAELAWMDGGATNRVTLEYTETSQLPGYTALKSAPEGLFGGNPDLGRERAETLSLAASREAPEWYGRVGLFHRRDDDLVDWTYRTGAPFVRQANAVDLQVTGLEMELARRWASLQVVGGFTYLHKDEDYGTAEVDASYYALNYARERLTLAVRYQPLPRLELRLDNEYARYRDNPLRTTGDDSYRASLALGWQTRMPGLRADVVADNLTNDDFQHFPGTPSPRRQISLRVDYSW